MSGRAHGRASTRSDWRFGALLLLAGSGCGQSQHYTRYCDMSCKDMQALCVAHEWVTVEGPVLDVDYVGLDSTDRLKFRDSTIIRIGEPKDADKFLTVLFDGKHSGGVDLTGIKPGALVKVRAHAFGQAYSRGERCRLTLADGVLQKVR